MIKISRRLISRSIGRKLTIGVSEFAVTLAYYLDMKMYKCADILLFQFIHYNKRLKIKDIPNELSQDGFQRLIYFLVLKGDYSSILYLLDDPNTTNYFKDVVRNTNIKNLTDKAGRIGDYKTLYHLCEAYCDGKAVLNHNNLLSAISGLSLFDKFIILRFCLNT